MRKFLFIGVLLFLGANFVFASENESDSPEIEQAASQSVEAIEVVEEQANETNKELSAPLPKEDAPNVVDSSNDTDNEIEADVIELDIEKSKIFTINTSNAFKETNKHSDSKPIKELQNREYLNTKTFFTQDNGENDYKITPNISAEDLQFRPSDTQTIPAGTLGPIKSEEDYKKNFPSQAQFTAGEPAHNPINFGKQLDF